MEPQQIFLFSQYSFERFAPAMLTFVIFIYLAARKKSDPAHRYLSCYFAFAFLYEAGHLITYSFYSPLGAYGWYLAALAPFGLIFLVLFAYSFSGERCRRESFVVLIIMLMISSAVYGDYVYNALKGGIQFRETGYAPVYSSKLIPLVVMIFYGWIVIVFVRNVLFDERNNSRKNIIRRFISPSTYGGWNGRNFALLVILDIVKVALLSSYIFFRALPYVTIISAVSALFLIAYALYAVVYVHSNLNQLSLTFKVTGSVFIINILIFSTMGYVALSQFENSYDDKRGVENRYLADAIRTGDFTSIPDEVDYIVKLTVPPYNWVYTKNPDFPEPQSIVLNDFTPGRWRFSNIEQEIHPVNAYMMKRYFVRINSVNYNQFIIEAGGERYGIGYNYYSYRKSANSPAFTLILIAVVSSIGIFLFIPVLLLRSKIFSDYNTDRFFQLSTMPQEQNNNTVEIPSSEKHIIEEYYSGKEEDYIVSSDTENKIQKVELYIVENYMYDISREGAARSVGMSPGRFGRAFLVCTGRKFSEYINDLRIEKAKVMLEGDASIIDIAYSVGFESLSTFSRAFNKNRGITPSAYRELIQKNK
jgi:AraC-like DNA-binding protein